jgi:putative ABC transport system permease protein
MMRARGIHIALALLTLCAVFAATVGVREALVTTTQALRQTVASASSSTTDITVSGVPSFDSSPVSLTDAQVSEITRQLHADYDGYDHGTVTLAPASADWASLTSQSATVQSPLPKVFGTAVDLEVTYRQPMSQYMRLVAGRFPAAPPPAVLVPKNNASGGRPAAFPTGSATYTPLLQVVVTQQTAATFGLQVGSRVQVPASGQASGSATITLQVSGIVAPTDPSSSFWTADADASTPILQNAGSLIPPPYWLGGVIAGPGEAVAVQQDFSTSFGSGLSMEWGLPLALGGITAQQAQPLSDALTSIAAQTPALSGDVAPMAGSLAAASNLLVTLRAFFATEQSVDEVLWLLYVGLTVTGLAVLLLTARMVAVRRSAELTIIRARGASLWQVGLAVGGAAAAVCVPAAAIGVALAVLAVHGPGAASLGSVADWWPPVAVLAAAVVGPAMVAVWEHRLPRHGVSRRHSAVGRRARQQVRLIVEVTLVAASVAGIIVFRQQGNGADAGTNPGVNVYTSAAPVLVAVPAVLVVLRIYPYVLRGLLRGAARSSRAPVFLGLARAVRSALTPAIPAFALVLALTMAAFAGMVRDAVTNGDVTASWNAVGADVTVSGSPAFPGFAIPPSAVSAISKVPGVTHTAAEWPASWLTTHGAQVTVLAVDPASYAVLVAATQGFPGVQPGLLAVPDTPKTAQPVLASPQAVAALGTGPVSIASQTAALRPLTVKVAGVLSATPGWPAGGAFLIMPLAALKSTATPPVPVPLTELQLSGTDINRVQLDNALQRDLPPGWSALLRSDVLDSMDGAPLQHGAFLLITLSVVLAAVLGLAVMFLELALGAAEREATLARLATMGLTPGQRAWVVVLEVMPAVLAAAVTAWACALALPALVAPAINLSVFNTTSIVVPLAPDVSNFVGTVPLVPDVASVALPLGALLVIAAMALGLEIGSRRRRGVAANLRIGD